MQGGIHDESYQFNCRNGALKDTTVHVIISLLHVRESLFRVSILQLIFAIHNIQIILLTIFVIITLYMFYFCCKKGSYFLESNYQKIIFHKFGNKFEKYERFSITL